jgi:hypothetical protein
MIAVTYAHPTISRFAIADGMLHIGGLPVGLLAPVPPCSSPTSAPASPGVWRNCAAPCRTTSTSATQSRPIRCPPWCSTSAGRSTASPIPADRVSFAGPGKTPAELSRAVTARVTISLGSETEALRVAAIGERRRMTVSPIAFLGHATPTELLV